MISINSPIVESKAGMNDLGVVEASPSADDFIREVRIPPLFAKP
jgi:hypothetical protein